jgi:hypothetical protein
MSTLTVIGVAWQMEDLYDDDLQHKPTQNRFLISYWYQIWSKDFVLISQSIFLYNTVTNYVWLFCSQFFMGCTVYQQMSVVVQWSRDLEKLIVAQLTKKCSPFMDPKGSLLCSLQPTTGPYPEPYKFSSYTLTLFLYDRSFQRIHPSPRLCDPKWSACLIFIVWMLFSM